MPFPVLLAADMLTNVIHGLSQESQARAGLKSLKQPAGYDITPEQQTSYNRAQGMSNYGFSPQERASYLSNLATQNNTSYNRAFRFGGNNLAGAIQAGINYGNNGALNTFAMNDANLHRQNIRYADSRGDAISNQRNRNTALQNQQYLQKQQAYGQALKVGKENVFGALNLFSSLNPMLGSGLFSKKASGGLPSDSAVGGSGQFGMDTLSGGTTENYG